MSENQVIVESQEMKDEMEQNICNDQIVEQDFTISTDRQDTGYVEDNQSTDEENLEIINEVSTTDTIDTEDVEDNVVENEKNEAEDSAYEIEVGSTTEEQEDVQSDNGTEQQGEGLEQQKQNIEIDEKTQEKIIWGILTNSIFKDFISDKFIIFTLDKRMIKCDKKEVRFAIASLLRQIKLTNKYSETLLGKFEKYFTDENNYNDFLFKVKEFDIQNLCLKPSIIKIHNRFFDIDNKSYCSETTNDINQIKICYNENATAPNWLKFIDDVTCGDTEYAQYLQKAVGSWLHGSNVQQAAFILTGNGANGKTVFMETIKKVFGSYAGVVDKHILLNDTLKTKTEYRNLIGKRIAIINELQNECHIKDDVFKRLTGNDTVNFNYKNKDIEFRNRAKFIILTNTIPVFDDFDEASCRRIKLLPFNNKFTGEKRDLFIIDRLEQELDGILNWIIEGYIMWKHENLEDEPDFITEMWHAHILGNDPIKEFLDKHCDISPEYKHPVTWVYGAYEAYCRNHYREPVSKNKFSTLLVSKGFNRIRLTDGSRGLKGLKIKLHPSVE